MRKPKKEYYTGFISGRVTAAQRIKLEKMRRKYGLTFGDIGTAAIKEYLDKINL